jgi:adenylate kinase family enzyme
MMRLLIAGGPGSGCTSTALVIGRRLGLPVFDSDAYFHKPTEPPFQEQYTPEERRERLSSALGAQVSWILSGSVATWELEGLQSTHGVFLDVPKDARMGRLEKRQRAQFGSRIDPDGDMAQEHADFMTWAAGYEGRTERGRNRQTDRAFLETQCARFLAVTEDAAREEVVARIAAFTEA